MIDDAPDRDDDREGVDHERGIEVLQVPRSDDDRRDEQRRRDRRPAPARNCSACRVTSAREAVAFDRALARQEDPRVEEPQPGSRQRQQSEPGPDDTQSIAKEPEQQRRKESAEAADRPDQPGDRGDCCAGRIPAQV